MLRRAGQQPKDGKSQIEQLLSLRWLADNPEMTRTAPEARGILTDVAQGKRGQDPQGFAKAYAARALASLDGKEPPLAPPIPTDSLRSEAFAWFPQRTGGDWFLAGIDVRASGALKLPEKNPLSMLVLKDADRDSLYDTAERLGNIRVDRAAFSVQPPGGKGREYVLLRATGSFDHDRIAKLIGMDLKDRKEMRGAKGEPILLFRLGGFFQVSGALVGDTDLIAFFSPPADPAQPFAEVEEVLDVRAKKKASAVEGSLSDLLKQAPDQAAGLLVGEISKGTREKARLAAAKSDPPLPQRFQLFLIRDRAVRLSGKATFTDKEEANAFETTVRMKFGEAREALKQVPPEVKSYKETIELLNKALAGIKVESRDDRVSLDAEISAELIRAAQKFFVENLNK